MATPEEFKEQFGRRGYLAEIMGVFTRNLRIKHVTWFSLVDDANETLQAIAVKSTEQSNDSAHCSVTSALNRYDRDDQLDRSGGYILGPGGADQAELNLDNLILIATSIGIGITNIVGEAEGNRRISDICERYEALSNGTSLGTATTTKSPTSCA